MKIQESKKKNSFNPQTFLDTAGLARKVVEFRRSESIYSQGDAANSVMYIQKGGVKLSVVNESGREAVVAMFGPTDFFGEGCMAGQSIRMGTATAITPSIILVITRSEMLRVLHDEHKLSDHFIAYMLAHKDRFDDAMMRELSEMRCGLPPGSDSAKVRKGGVGGHKVELPAQVAADLDAKWAELAAPATSHADYASLEAAVRAPA